MRYPIVFAVLTLLTLSLPVSTSSWAEARGDDMIADQEAHVQPGLWGTIAFRPESHELEEQAKGQLHQLSELLRKESELGLIIGYCLRPDGSLNGSRAAMIRAFLVDDARRRGEAIEPGRIVIWSDLGECFRDHACGTPDRVALVVFRLPDGEAGLKRALTAYAHHCELDVVYSAPPN